MFRFTTIDLARVDYRVLKPLSDGTISPWWGLLIIPAFMGVMFFLWPLVTIWIFWDGFKRRYRREKYDEGDAGGGQR
jgi:hypothetical protein